MYHKPLVVTDTTHSSNKVVVMQTKSSNVVAVDGRLNDLRYSLGLSWGELAARLDISRSMLGFVRRGKKPLSAQLAFRISQLEQETGKTTQLESATGASSSAVDLRSQVLSIQKHLLAIAEEVRTIADALNQ